MSPLVPCPSCARHVRASDAACPFCAASISPDAATHAVPAATRRLDRLAVATFAASLVATSTAGCSPKTTGNESPPTVEPTAIAAAYGAPAPPPEVAKPTPAPDAGATPAASASAAPSASASPSAKPTTSAKPPAPPKPLATDPGAPAPAYGLPPPHTLPQRK